MKLQRAISIGATMTLEESFDDYLSAFAHTSARQELFSQEADAAEQSSLVGVKISMDSCETAVVPMTMRRGEAEPPKNHQKSRLQSTNERMRDSNRRKGCCSLCWSSGHRAKGGAFRCEVVTGYNAMLVAGIGNPMLYVVKQPEDDKNRIIRQLFENIISDEIPKNAWHLVLLNCYFSAMDNQRFEYNVVEVAALEERGKELSGYENAYFPVFRIQEWLKEHCCKLNRTKHVLSTLQRQTQRLLPATMYRYRL
jgi:hypothetical protein